MNYETKSGFVAIVGRANVGKSSLLNAMIGEKIAIVSDKPQTTRTRITGVITRDAVQLAFIDTPGMHRPRNSLSEYMVKQVTESVGDVDAAVLVVEAGVPLGDIENQLIQNFAQRKLPAVAVINKMDTVQDKSVILSQIAALSQLYSFDHIYPLSAKSGEGVDDFIKLLEGYAQPGPHYFEDEKFTDQPEKVLAAEMVREKLLRNLRDEVPHGTAVVVETMKEHTARSGEEVLDVDAIIYCERENHKGMIIGKGGATLKRIATQARGEMERFFQIQVNLKCWVKVKEDWRNREQIMRSFGYN